MAKQIQPIGVSEIIEGVIIGGDLSRLSPAERVNYYKAVCQSIGLNPLTKPFDYITLSGKLTLYARKDATDQLRNIYEVSITKLDKELIQNVYTVMAYASTPNGRTDISTGAVNIEGMKGDLLANALMKAETKAKRRVTLSICGLGMLDETEMETISDAHKVTVADTGELLEAQFKEPALQDANIKAPAAQASTNGHGDRPYSAHIVKDGIKNYAKKHKDFKLTKAQQDLLRYGLELCFPGDPNVEDKRHTLLKYLTGEASTKNIPGSTFKAIVEDWLKMIQDSGGAECRDRCDVHDKWQSWRGMQAHILSPRPAALQEGGHGR